MPELRKGLHFRSIDGAGLGCAGRDAETASFEEIIASNGLPKEQGVPIEMAIMPQATMLVSFESVPCPQ